MFFANHSIWVSHTIHVWYSYPHLVDFIVHVGKYTIHGWYGYRKTQVFLLCLGCQRKDLLTRQNFTVNYTTIIVRLVLLQKLGWPRCFGFNMLRCFLKRNISKWLHSMLSMSSCHGLQEIVEC